VGEAAWVEVGELVGGADVPTELVPRVVDFAVITQVVRFGARSGRCCPRASRRLGWPRWLNRQDAALVEPPRRQGAKKRVSKLQATEAPRRVIVERLVRLG
jgi:hypothetical protein